MLYYWLIPPPLLLRFEISSSLRERRAFAVNFAAIILRICCAAPPRFVKKEDTEEDTFWRRRRRRRCCEYSNWALIVVRVFFSSLCFCWLLIVALLLWCLILCFYVPGFYLCLLASSSSSCVGACVIDYCSHMRWTYALARCEWKHRSLCACDAGRWRWWWRRRPQRYNIIHHTSFRMGREGGRDVRIYNVYILSNTTCIRTHAIRMFILRPLQVKISRTLSFTLTSILQVPEYIWIGVRVDAFTSAAYHITEACIGSIDDLHTWRSNIHTVQVHRA